MTEMERMADGDKVQEKSWRPEDWDTIKKNIVTETPIVFSPSSGYSGNQKDDLMEKAADAVIREFKRSPEYLELIEKAGD